MLNFRLAALFLAASVASTAGEPSLECYEEVEHLHTQNSGLLLRATESMLTAYNDKCFDDRLCKLDTPDETREYLQTFDMSDPVADILEDIQITGKLDATFHGFKDKSYTDLKIACDAVDGKLCHTIIEAKFRGKALESYDVDLMADIDDMPFCLVDSCHHDDLTLLAEEAVKRTLLALTAPQQQTLTEQQIGLIEGMDLKAACALLGLDTCFFHVKPAENCELSSINAFDLGFSASAKTYLGSAFSLAIASSVYSLMF